MKTIDLGHCGTCGRKVDAAIDWTAFIDSDGSDLPVITVEGHCGIGGHAMKLKTVARDDYDALPDWTPDRDQLYFVD